MLHDIATHIAIGPDNTDGGVISNQPNLSLFIKKQDYIRKINIRDYLNFDENLFKNNSANSL